MKEQHPVAREFLSMYGLFLLCYTVIHLKFEWNFWTQDDFAIFAKYAQGDSPAAHLAVAKAVYFSKATWMIFLVWLCALKITFRRALAISFLYYAIALLFCFPSTSTTPSTCSLPEDLPSRNGVCTRGRTPNRITPSGNPAFCAWRDLDYNPWKIWPSTHYH